MIGRANNSLLQLARTRFVSFQSKLRNYETRRINKKISEVLRLPLSPETLRAEREFEKLQGNYAPRPEYGYDRISLWQRATTRSLKLVSLPGMEAAGKQILDLGTGDGMIGAALNAFGHRTTLVDQEDWRHETAKTLPFKEADCCKALPFDDGAFDLVCSYNSFEHFPTPETVLTESLRVLKPGGWFYTEFNPLYFSPWGLHAYRALLMPYPQFLFSEDFISKKLHEIGIWDLGKKRTELQFLNKWKVSQFDTLWRRTDCSIISEQKSYDFSGLSLVLDFPEAFCGRGLSVEDLTVSGITVAIKKK